MTALRNMNDDDLKELGLPMVCVLSSNIISHSLIAFSGLTFVYLLTSSSILTFRDQGRKFFWHCHQENNALCI